MRHQDRKQQWDKDSVSRKMERERLQSVMEPAKDKKTKKNGKTEVTWHGSVRFPVCVKQKKKKKRVHNSKHTLKVWGGSQHNAHIKKKRPHRSNGLTLGVFWGAKYKKIQWTGPIKRKAAIIKTHLNVTELSIKCISKNRKKAKKKKINKRSNNPNPKSWSYASFGKFKNHSSNITYLKLGMNQLQSVSRIKWSN